MRIAIISEYRRETVNYGNNLQAYALNHYLNDCIRIAMKCRNEEYDVVICQGLNPFIALCAMMIHFFSKHTRILGYVHFSPEDWKQKTALSFRVIFKYSEKIICISDYVLNSVKKRFGYDNKLVRIYNGVDVSKFSCSGVTTKKSGHRLVYVGRLIEKKGVDITLRALSKVTADFHFDIIGDGIYRSKLEEQVKELGLEEKVTFHGNVLNIRPLLESSDIFIHVPTLEEGFGLTVVEAMAAGLLCICSKSGALPEIIENGVTGYLVEKDDSEELARVIQSSIENYKNEQNEDIRKNAVEKAKKYTIDSYSDNIDKIASEIRGGGVTLIYVGRLEKVKGVQDILKSLAKIKDIPYIFNIVGEGSYRQELEKLTHELGIDDNVNFLGMRRDIPELLWKSDVFVHLPEWQEGFGITIIEAMAAGLICIVNDHGALPEIVQDGINGFVIHDMDRQFDKIIKTIVDRSNENQICQMRKAAIMRAENFSIQKYSAKLDSIIADK